MLGLCKYCGLNAEIRNPSGNCDHLYYPDNVNKDFMKEFKRDYKNRLMSRGGLTNRQAEDTYQAAKESKTLEYDETPEYNADEEMDCWSR